MLRGLYTITLPEGKDPLQVYANGYEVNPHGVLSIIQAKTDNSGKTFPAIVLSMAAGTWISIHEVDALGNPAYADAGDDGIKLQTVGNA